MSSTSQFFGGKSLKFQEFLSSGTFTPSAALLAAGGNVTVLLVGGGSGTGGALNGGAGGSGYCRVEWFE